MVLIPSADFYRTIETATIVCSNKSFDNFIKVLKNILFRRLC